MTAQPPKLPTHSAAAFVAFRTAEALAKQLRTDIALIEQGRCCSWAALYMPSSATQKASDIAEFLSPSPNLSNDIKRMLYESMVSRVNSNLNDNGIYATQHEIDAANRRYEGTQHVLPEMSREQLCTALEVLDRLKHVVLDPSMPLDKVIDLLKEMTITKAGDTKNVHWPYPPASPTSGSQVPNPPILPRKRLCYICHLQLTVPHPAQPSMCTPCGEFSLASSRLSSPSILTLPPTFTALVTGARINLGYCTTLRLLRCGARVLATSRYPRDAIARYVQESDFPVWENRLKILGADFRSALDVFALVKDVRQCLREWGRSETLQLLVNNAAQTFTDTVRKEDQAIERETSLSLVIESSRLYRSGSYKPRVRGGGSSMALGGLEKDYGLIRDTEENLPIISTAVHDKQQSHKDSVVVETYTKSSWVQSIFEIPYEDVISAHSINTFVPLILCRELLPLMGEERILSEQTRAQVTSTKPRAYIINVSSHEGIFEDRARSIGKAGKHVHTNMSKAALNMITETEAALAWKSRRFAMNTVDPGYMSAAPEYENSSDGQRPIGWEDGAGRVL